MKFVRSSAIAIAATLAATAAGAQTSAPNFALPKAYQGYSQPEAVACATKDPTRRECVVPAMTAGRYLVVAAGSATSTGADANQSLGIFIGGASCFLSRPVAFSGAKAMRGACEVNFLTDQPVTIAAIYKVNAATPDAKGPQLQLRRLPWNGVIEAKPLMLPATPPAKK